MKRLATSAAAVALCTTFAYGGMLDPNLESVLDQTPADETVSALIYMTDQLDAAGITAEMDAQSARLIDRYNAVVPALQQMAQDTQAGVLAQLYQAQQRSGVEEINSFWIANIIQIKARPQVIRDIANHIDVDMVYLDYGIELIQPVDEDPNPRGGGRAPESGVTAVRAPEVWALGYDGSGVLVSTLDTGVDGNHAAVASRWRGLDPAYLGHPEWAFFDPETGWTFPQDSGDHGTHTMGSVCGGAPGDEIGVAPGAEWIHAAVIDRSGIAQTVADAIAAFQWVIDPDGNLGTGWDVPDTCSNSWGLVTSHGYPPCDTTFWAYLDNVEAAGIVIIFSAGNEGSSPNTLRRPSDRATDDYRTFSVGAVDGADPPSYPVASFSSRGPSNCTPDGSAAIKPDIAAPGVSVRSSLPGGGYGNKSGTSMSSPHVNGVIALMRQANPDLAPDQIKQIIYDTALDLGSAGKDNDYGYGMIDAYEAVQAALATVAISFTFPDGFPELIDPAGGTTIRVVVSGQPEPGTGMFYYNVDGGAYTAVAMDVVSPNVYDAVFPAFACGADVTYYFSAESTDGETGYNPSSAPASTYAASAYTGLSTLLTYDFEADPGWTAENLGATSGDWQRGVPVNDPGWDYDPASDSDGSGQCYLTQNVVGNTDIDDGAVRLTSSAMDLSGGGAVVISYDYYLYLTDTGGSVDMLLVEMSSNGDAGPWIEVHRHVTSGGLSWRSHAISQATLDANGVTLTSNMKIRFTANDADPQSINEAGIDAFAVSQFFCDPPVGECPEDLDGLNGVGQGDLNAVLNRWGDADCLPGGAQHPCPEDLDGLNGVGQGDLNAVLNRWGDPECE